MTDAVFEWRIPPEEALVALFDTYTRQLLKAIEAVLQRRAPEIEAWMKTNAPWTDRSGNARQTLYTKAFLALTEAVLLMAHGMEYGIYLELSNGGAYAIIGPAVDVWAPVIMDDLRRLGLRVA